MARHFGPIAVPKNIEPWLYNALNRLNESTEQSSSGLAAIVRGEAPDGSGTPLVPDLTNYFYKPGLQGGQLAHGAIESGGFLKLSSTAHTTKGLIYLGTALNTAYDELNSRFGIGTVSPAAKLHVKGEAPGSVFWRPSQSILGAGFALAGGAFEDVMSEETIDGDGDTTYIAAITNNPSQTMALTFNAIVGDTTTFPTGTTGWVFKWSAKKIPVGAVTYNWALRDQLGNTVRSGTGEVATAGYTTVTLNLTEAEATQIIGSSNSSMGFVVSGFTGLPGGFSDTNWRLSWVQLEIPSSSAGAGLGGYTALFDVDAFQAVDNSQWRNSAGTALISISAAGRLTVESGGSMRFVPGAGANEILYSTNASGDIALVPVSGDVTMAAGVFTIANDAVTFAKMQNVTGPTLIGRVTGTSGDMSALTPTEATALLNVFTTSLKGLVPSGGSNTTFLRGDATWQPLTDSGWTDDGAVVRLTTSTNQVGIGTASPAASLAVVNVNATTDIVFKVVGIASQSGSLVSVQNNSARNLFSVGPTGSIQIGNSTDTGNILVTIGGDSSSSGTIAAIMFKDNFVALGAPVQTADYVGCVGAKFYAYKDVNGQFDAAYGQGFADAWVLISDETIQYNFYTGVTPAGSPSFLRCTWDGNGDYTNYGFIHSRKSLGAGTPGIPQLRLEETGTGTQYISLRAPAAVAANRTQLLFDVNGTIPIVGDDPPAVASRALGKVDDLTQAAAIGATNLTNSPPTGMYLVQYYLETVTADATAGTLTFQINHTDDIGATTQVSAALDLTATTIRISGTFQAYLASGNLSYQTNVATGAINNARYTLRVRVMYLG